MHEKMQEFISSTVTPYAWVLLLSFWGGMAGYIGKIKQGHCRFSVSELVGEVVISGFVGIITYLICQSSGIDPLLSAALVGISAHMGSQAIFMMEKFLQNKVKTWLGTKD